jgi:hypothetical protein
LLLTFSLGLDLAVETFFICPLAGALAAGDIGCSLVVW